MFSIHDMRYAVLAMVVLAGGCKMASEETRGEDMQLNPSILPEDEAMHKRNWALTGWKYENTSTLSGPTGKMWVAEDNGPANSIIEPFVFIGDIAVMPITLAITPPWTDVYNRAVNVEPSYTAVPPVPMK